MQFLSYQPKPTNLGKKWMWSFWFLFIFIYKLIFKLNFKLKYHIYKSIHIINSVVTNFLGLVSSSFAHLELGRHGSSSRSLCNRMEGVCELPSSGFSFLGLSPALNCVIQGQSETRHEASPVLSWLNASVHFHAVNVPVSVAGHLHQGPSCLASQFGWVAKSRESPHIFNLIISETSVLIRIYGSRHKTSFTLYIQMNSNQVLDTFSM